MTLSEGLQDVAKALGGKRYAVQARIASVWAEAVGPEISRHTHVSAIRAGELVVAVDSSAWATELTAMGTHLLGRVNEALGQSAVRAMRFTVSAEVEGERVREEREEQVNRGYGEKDTKPIPLTPEERARAEALFAGVTDERLRDAARRAAIRDLEWKKGVEEARKG